MLTQPEIDAQKLWKSKKAVNCAFPDTVKCKKCEKEHDFSLCRDLRIHAAYPKTKKVEMSIGCAGEDCDGRIHFKTTYSKKRQKPKVR